MALSLIPSTARFAEASQIIGSLNSLIQSLNAQPFTSATVVANGAVATAMTSLGPTGSHTTIQEWFAVPGTGGAIRYVAGF
jgi:hypothetical protein